VYLAGWFLSPMCKNPVLEEFRRLAVIQEEMC